MTKETQRTEIIDKNDPEIGRLSKLTQEDVERLAKTNPAQIFEYKNIISRLINIKPPIITNPFVLSALEAVFEFFVQAIRVNKLVDTKQEQKSENKSEDKASTDDKQALVIDIDQKTKEILATQSDFIDALEKGLEGGNLKISDQNNNEITINQLKQVLGNAACFIGKDSDEDVTNGEGFNSKIKGNVQELYTKFKNLGFGVTMRTQGDNIFFGVDYDINPLTANEDDIRKALDDYKNQAGQVPKRKVHGIVISNIEPTKENIEAALKFRQEELAKMVGLTTGQIKEEQKEQTEKKESQERVGRKQEEEKEKQEQESGNKAEKEKKDEQVTQEKEEKGEIATERKQAIQELKKSEATEQLSWAEKMKHRSGMLGKETPSSPAQKPFSFTQMIMEQKEAKTSQSSNQSR